MGYKTNNLRGSHVPAHFAERECVIALTEALACLVDKQRMVAELRLGEAQQTIEIELLRGGEEQISATDDLRYTHLGIIDDDG